MESIRQIILVSSFLGHLVPLQGMHDDNISKLNQRTQLHNQLCEAVKKNNSAEITKLMLDGAKIKVKEKKKLKKLSPLHLAAISNNPLTIQSLLISPQGGPSLETKYIKKMKKRWFSLLLCLNRLSTTTQYTQWSPPAEVLGCIFSHFLPNTQLLADNIPLRNLPHYKKYMSPAYKDLLINKLAKRHLNKLRIALKQKALLQKKQFTPVQLAQANAHGIASILLNPRAIGNLEDEIRARYSNMLK